ncbi:MAG: hypothetical protein AAGF84_03090 [Planctomycetota bacterium]
MKSAIRASSRRRNRVALAAAFPLFAALSPAAAQTTTTFNFTNDIDLGAQVEGNNDWSWDFFLGVEKAGGVDIGGIVGKPNATIIPEIRDPFFGNVIIPKVTGDTRTGIRVNGDVGVRTGLELFADFEAGGLNSGALFDFNPTLSRPDVFAANEFISLTGATNINTNTSFTDQDVDLPAFSAGMDFVFDLDIDTNIEYGLFPFVGYNKVDFSPDPVNVRLPLFEAGINLDPDPEPGFSVPGFPTFNLPDFGIDILPGPEVSDTDVIFEKQISLEPKQKKDANGNPIGDPPPSGFNIDIGEVELVRPVRGADLQIETQINEDSVGYTVDANILRLGLDLDGIASAAAFGTSFTNFETGIDGVGSIEFDLIDIKYGPELGYKQDHTITPELEAVLTFSEDVLIDFDGTLVVTDTLTGDWTDLPDIALLGDTPVDVTVDFTEYEAFVKQNGYVTIGDYMELKALELTLQQELGIPFLPEELTLGPVIHERFSILGDLLGEIEIPVFENEKSLGTFSLAGNSLTNANFTLTPTPSPRLLLSNPGQTPDLLSTWKSIDDGSTPGTLANTTLVIGSMDLDPGTNQMIVSPEVYVDPGHTAGGTGPTVDVAALDILDGSAIIQTGARRYDLDRISNRGSYVSNGYTEFNAGTASLSIRGNGGDIIFNGGSKLVAGLMIHGENHTLVFRENNPTNAVAGTSNIHQFQISQTLNNDGVIIADNSRLDINLNAGAELVSSGPNAAIIARNGADVTIDALELKGNGRYEATGAGTSMTFDNIALPNPVAPGNPDRVFTETGDTGPQLLADQGASLTLLGKTNVFGNARFAATQGGNVAFTGILKQVSGNIVEAPKIVLETDATGTIELNGLEMPQFTSEEQANAYEGGFDIVNRGLLDIQSGENFLIVDPPNSSGPFGGGGDPFPVAKPVDLLNEGTVRVHTGARFGFDVDITNYVAGGASLDQGTWELLGTPGAFSNLTADDQINGSTAASLLIFVDKVSNDETYLGTVDFDDDPNYSLDDFDTQLKFNQATVTLSGQAYFPYFNTVEENFGTINLREGIVFRTATDFINRGQVNVESNARLDVAGNYTVGPGGVSNHTANGLAVDGTVEVLGGTLNLGDSGDSIPALAGFYEVREVWAGFDEQGDDVFIPVTFNLGNDDLQSIAGGAVVVEGENVNFAALDGLQQIDAGATLEVLGGFELRLDQNLTVEGTLKLDDAAKLYLDTATDGSGGELFSTGDLIVGSESFIEIAGGLTVTAGTIQLDGVINAPLIDISENVVVTGSGRLTGSLNNAGRFSPGSSPGAFETFDLFAQLSTGTLALEITSAEEGETHDQLILNDGGVLDGTLELIFDDVRPMDGQSWVLIDNRAFLFGDFASLQVSGLDAALAEDGVTKVDASDELLGSRGGLNLYLTRFGGDGDDLAVYATIGAFLSGDFNGDGTVEQGDLNLVLGNWGSDTAGNIPAGWLNDLPLGTIDQAELNAVLNNWGSSVAPDFAGFDVPEPATAVVLGAFAVAGLRRRAA